MTNPLQTVHQVNGSRDWPLHSMKQTLEREAQLKRVLPPHTLMQRAGKATAQLALAIAPHAKNIWIACGSGNNGGDGLEAALHLLQHGKHVSVTYLGQPENAPHDAKLSWQRAIHAGVNFQENPIPGFDLAIDALLGLGCNKAPSGTMADWLEIMRSADAPTLSIDLPTGLQPDTGEWLGGNTTPPENHPRHTLSLLTLKVGLFTADGRDAAGQVWFDDLLQSDFSQLIVPQEPFAHLLSECTHKGTQRVHNSHKGHYGNLMVIGGAPGMSGAAILAGMAGLHAGAGRVYLTLLDKSVQASAAIEHPALMTRNIDQLKLQSGCVVCGCGGSEAIKEWVPLVLSQSQSLVLDADALNAIATDRVLMKLLNHRAQRQNSTVITPHPLEAAKLLGCSVQQVQNNRVEAAVTLAQLTQAVVVLKGSGTVICDPYSKPAINCNGNALLATPGTGDVLAGLIGAKIAQGQTCFAAACDGVRLHGAAADAWARTGRSMDATMLATSIH